MVENINEILIVAIVNEIQGLEFVEIEEKEIEGEAVSALRYPTGFTYREYVYSPKQKARGKPLASTSNSLVAKATKNRKQN